MYLYETGFGQTSKAPAKWPFKQGWVVKDGHRRQCFQFPGGNDGGCTLELKVKFRRSFEDFLREVENAIGTWVARPTARMFIKVKNIRLRLKECHQDFLKKGVLNNDPIIVQVIINYSRSKGQWVVVSGLVDTWWRLIDL